MAYRRGPFSEIKLPLAWVGGAATVAALVAALALLFGGRSEAVAAESYAPARNAVAAVMKPVEGAFAAPIRWIGDAVGYVEGYFFAVSENRRLRREVAELESWRDTAIALKNVNDRYEALLKLKTQPPIPMVAAHTIMDSRGPFSDARLLDVGARAGVQVGDPALSEHGVVGRVVGVTGGASRLLMLTDVDSRTPVLVDRSNGRAILTGDGGLYPRLDYLRGRDALKVGDAILTSGDGGVFPRGLPVGVAVKDLKGGWRVRLYSDATPIDLVRVLLFQAFDQSPDARALSDAESAPPPLSPAEAADRSAALQKAAAPAPARAVSRQPSQPLEPQAWIALPWLACLGATLVFATPLRVFGLQLPEPVFPLVLAFAWPVIRPSVLGPLALLAAGLFLDLAWGAPLGFWALCLLVVYGGAELARSLMTGRSALALAGWYLGLNTIAFGAAYLLTTLRAHVNPTGTGTVLQFVATVALFPFARLLIDRFEDADIRFR